MSKVKTFFKRILAGQLASILLFFTVLTSFSTPVYATDTQADGMNYKVLQKMT